MKKILNNAATVVMTFISITLGFLVTGYMGIAFAYKLAEYSQTFEQFCSVIN